MKASRYPAMSQNACDLEYKLLTQDKIQEALMLQTETMKQEPVAIALGMLDEPGAPEQMRLLFREIVKDGVTIIAVDKETDQLAAVAFNKIHAKPREGVEDQLAAFIEKNLKKQPCLDLVKFLDDLESSVDVFERYNVDGAMELFYVGTSPRHQGRGIGSLMVKKCIELGKGLLNGTMKKNALDDGIVNEEVVPKVIFGAFVSSFSQRIAETLNFETLHQVRYDDVTIGGRKLSDRIGKEQRTAKFLALKL